MNPNLPIERPDYLARLASIDPGKGSLGFVVLDFMPDNRIRLNYVTTFKGVYQAKRYPMQEDVYTNSDAQLYGLAEEVIRRAINWNVDWVHSEAPYMGSFATAYKSLVGCLTHLQQALYRLSPQLPYTTIDPASVKTLMGVSGRSGDKDEMTVALMSLVTYFILPYGVSFETMNEHEVDAICIGIYWGIVNGLFKSPIKPSEKKNGKRTRRSKS